MRRFLVLSVLALLVSTYAVGQQTTAAGSEKKANTNCTQVLRLARAVYEQGRLHELGNLLDDCLKGEVGSTSGFATVQEKVDAYRLLCLSYIYLEEPKLADEAMLGLLQTDHFFKVNETDPAEFQALLHTFRTEPVFSFGAKVGANMTFAHILKNYSVFSESPKQGKYKPGISFSAAGFAEKEFFPNLKDTNPLKWTVVRAEVFFQLNSYKMNYPQVAIFPTTPNDVSAIFDGKSASQRLDLNFILRYRYAQRKTKGKTVWDPYIGLGPGVSLLLGSSINQAKLERERLLTDGGTVTSDSYSGPSIDTKPAFLKLVNNVSAVWGVNRRAGAFYLNFEARYQFGLQNLVNPAKRTIDPLVYDYGVTINDYRQSNIILCAGITYPYFKPKKLTKRK